MNENADFLDFCRVKKIFDKGFGFLKSIYFEQDAFFHFSKVKDKEVKEKLEELKRGVVYVFYTSQASGNKRRVKKLWFDLGKVDQHLIPPFAEKIIDCFNGSRTNPYELAHVVMLLRNAELFNRNQFEKLFYTSGIKRIPSVLISMLNDDEKTRFEDLENLCDKAGESGSSYQELKTLLLRELY